MIYVRMTGDRCDSFEDVLEFWFSHPEKSIGEITKFWFRGGPDVDNLIKRKVGHLVVAARKGLLCKWADLSYGIQGTLLFYYQYIHYKNIEA